MQQGECSALAHFVQHSGIMGAAARGHAIQVARLIHREMPILGARAVWSTEAVENGEPARPVDFEYRPVREAPGGTEERARSVGYQALERAAVPLGKAVQHHHPSPNVEDSAKTSGTSRCGGPIQAVVQKYWRLRVGPV